MQVGAKGAGVSDPHEIGGVYARYQIGLFSVLLHVLQLHCDVRAT